MSRMEMIYIDSDNQGRKTGIGAIFETPAETWAAFLSAKRLAVPIEKAEFILDYYNRKGDLADSIPLNRESYEFITRAKALSEAQYRDIDAAFWRDLRTELAAEKRAGALAMHGTSVKH